LKERGLKVVAVSVDPVETTRKHVEKQGYPFIFLSDEKMDAIRKYDLLHPAGFRGADISRPGEFLIDPTGTIRWRDLTENYRVRIKGEDVLKGLDQLGVK
jgi:peroxiredoxin